jgi:hypothetical protein
MARSLGEFGTAVAEATEDKEAMTFLLGPAKDEFYVDEISFVSFGRLAEAAHNGLSTNVSEGASAIYNLMRDVIGPNPGKGATKKLREESSATKEEEWHRFEDSARKQKVTIEDMLAIIMAVLSGSSGKADQPPSGSSSGRRKTGTSRSSNRKPSSDGTQPITKEMLAELGG